MEVAFEEFGDLRVTYEAIRRQLAIDLDNWWGGKGGIVWVAFPETAGDEPWQKSQKQDPHPEGGTAKDCRTIHSLLRIGSPKRVLAYEPLQGRVKRFEGVVMPRPTGATAAWGSRRTVAVRPGKGQNERPEVHR
jgi:hypothetical protein